MSEPARERLVDDVEAGPGGAMTDDVGVITGELTVATTPLGDGRAQIEIQYAQADECGTPSPAVPLPSRPAG
ncbi:hypothetical protein [Streptomyces sp. NPDC050485]|uniref:hypothetical protein n=1 Tax=Streptomyces sp. NPDC050485 TaxID=3365617 RepID=UPI0037B88B24